MTKTLQKHIPINTFDRGFTLIVAKGYYEGHKDLNPELGLPQGMEDIPGAVTRFQNKDTRQFALTMFLEKAKSIEARAIVHESLHMTRHILELSSITNFNEQTEEVYCYLCDYIFSEVVDFLKQNKVRVV